MKYYNGHGLDELDQLNDILHDLYVDDELKTRYDIKDADGQMSRFTNSPPITSQGRIH